MVVSHGITVPYVIPDQIPRERHGNRRDRRVQEAGRLE
jgi:hypothetical protein